MKFENAPVEYNEEWPLIFEKEKKILLEKINVQIEHIGSTSVPGMFAKPIIDVLIIAPNLATLTEPMTALHYTFKGEYGIPGRAYFTRPGFHVHCFETGSPEIKKHLAYRDYLRSHPEEARKYSDLKKSICDRPDITRQQYQEAKNELLMLQTAEAVRWYKN